MSGIGNYFHGEEGVVRERRWLFTDETMSDVLLLDGDPHRNYALDYGSDIRFDPAITPGDRVVYVRLGPTAGFWCRKGDEYTPRLDEALERRSAARDVAHQYVDFLGISPLLARTWGRLVAARAGWPAQFAREKNSPYPPREMPWAVSIFLSHSGRNSLLTDAIFKTLSTEAKAQVWYDRTRPGGAPGHDEAIATWLRDAIYETQLFVIVLTRASVASGWVRKEIHWAAEKARTSEGFRLIVLDMEGVSSQLDPQSARDARRIVDCRGLWLGEIAEELHAAVYGREGRQAWRQEQLSRGWSERSPENRPPDYEHLTTDGGVAIRLEWLGEDAWRLLYDADGEERQATGRGELEMVDPEIQPGDRVCSTAWQWFRKSVWMRSERGAKPGEAIDAYGEVSDAYHERIHPHERPGCMFCSSKRETPVASAPPWQEAWRWWAALCSCLVIAAAVCVAMFVFDPKQYAEFWPLAAAQALRIIVAVSIVVFGTYQLAWSLHNESDFKSVYDRSCGEASSIPTCTTSSSWA